MFGPRRRIAPDIAWMVRNTNRRDGPQGVAPGASARPVKPRIITSQTLARVWISPPAPTAVWRLLVWAVVVIGLRVPASAPVPAQSWVTFPRKPPNFRRSHMTLITPPWIPCTPLLRSSAPVAGATFAERGSSTTRFCACRSSSPRFRPPSAWYRDPWNRLRCPRRRRPTNRPDLVVSGCLWWMIYPAAKETRSRHAAIPSAPAPAYRRSASCRDSQIGAALPVCATEPVKTKKHLSV